MFDDQELNCSYDDPLLKIYPRPNSHEQTRMSDPRIPIYQNGFTELLQHAFRTLSVGRELSLFWIGSIRCSGHDN